MKHFRKCFLVCTIVILGITEVYAQTAYNEIRPSVNAQQFLSAATSSASLQKGQLAMNIPLFNLQGKGIDVPISVSFNSGSITHQSEASGIGLGWSLLAGGVITRTVRGAQDPSNAAPQDLPWQYDANYLVNKWTEEQNDIYTDNLFDLAMTAVNIDAEPDGYNYSFLGNSGEICFKYNADHSITGTLYPDKSFRIQKTTGGYKIVANDGIEYLFEAIEQTNNNATSWFLTEIKTLQGGHVVFQYSDDCSYDPTYQLGPDLYAPSRSKRLTRIDFDYGYVIFGSADRSDKQWENINEKSKRITNIELYDKGGSLIKGFLFSNNSYMGASNNWTGKRLKLESLREYDRNGIYLPPCEFEYSFNFYRSKSSELANEPFPEAPRNTWAANPANMAFADRNLMGQICSWMNPCEIWGMPTTCPMGFEARFDELDGYTLGEYLCLTKVKLPSGGSESYYYENHDFHAFATSPDFVPYDNHIFITGKRLWKKEITDGNGGLQTVLYKYILHDQNYQPIIGGSSLPHTTVSSGILYNPSIHTSVMYKPAYDYNRPRLKASSHYTKDPQNSPSGTPVCYTEVEEIHLSGSGETNGKKIYYFEKMVAVPAANFVYLNYTQDGASFTSGNYLVNLPNTLCGKQQYFEPGFSEYNSNENYTYLAYPVGRFYITHLNESKLLKEVTLSANGDLVKKISNEYSPGNPEVTLYGLVIQKFDDNDYGNNPNPSYPVNRYLISQVQVPFGLSQLLKSTTINYYQGDSIVQDQTFVYTGLNLLKSSSTTVGDGKELFTENVYPNEISFQTLSNLSPEASSIKAMKDANMIGIPLQTTTKKGTEYISGSYSAYKQLPNNALVIDTKFSLAVQGGASVSVPIVNSNGIVERSSNFILDKNYLAYDENANPVNIVERDGLYTAYLWGYSDRYMTAEVKNAYASDIAYSSFEDNGKGNWNYNGTVTTPAAGTFVPTGRNYYNLTASTGIDKTVSNGKTYIISYWRNAGSPYTVNGGSGTVTTGPTVNGWTYFEHRITATGTTISISGTGGIDEMRLYTANALMTTYTYDPLIGITTLTDANSRTSYYVYDAFGRLQVIKDKDGNIVKTFEYKYRQ